MECLFQLLHDKLSSLYHSTAGGKGPEPSPRAPAQHPPDQQFLLWLVLLLSHITSSLQMLQNRTDQVQSQPNLFVPVLNFKANDKLALMHQEIKKSFAASTSTEPQEVCTYIYLYIIMHVDKYVYMYTYIIFMNMYVQCSTSPISSIGRTTLRVQIPESHMV